MPVAINFKKDFKKLTKGLTKWERKAVPKAASFAINRAMTTVRAKAATELSKVMNLLVSKIKRELKTFRSTLRTLTAIITATGRRLNVKGFKGRETKKGLVAIPWGKRRVWRTGFLGNKRRTAFIRKGPNRLDIEALHGPGVVSEFVRKPIEKLMRTVGTKAFLKNFSRDLKRRLGGTTAFKG